MHVSRLEGCNVSKMALSDRFPAFPYGMESTSNRGELLHLIAIAVPFNLCKIGRMLSVAPLTSSDIAEIVAAFVVFGWGGKDRAQYEGYLLEQDAGVRDVLVARTENDFAGYVTWRSDYPPFRDSNIPEVHDLNVLPQDRRKHIGTRLMDEAERLISPRSPVVGIGVGLHSDYGAAQRFYVWPGYVPDARGITSHGTRVGYGDVVSADDDLVLWLIRNLS